MEAVMPDLTDAAIGGGGVGVGVALGVAALRFAQALIEKRRTPAQQLGDAAGAASELIKLALDASGTSVQQLLEELQGMRAEVADLRREVDACHSREMAGGARSAQLEQINRSLINVLRRQGIDLPSEAGVGAFYELAGEEVTALAPVRGMKAGSET